MASLTTKLKKGNISLAEVLQLSYLYYKKFDNKAWRATMDCRHIYIVKRQNYHYDRSKRTWVQTGRESKIVFNVTSRPVSYKKTDKYKIHSYPVTFLLRDISMGMNSAFRWRTGSLRKPRLAKKGKKYSSKERVKMQEWNIKNHIQLKLLLLQELQSEWPPAWRMTGRFS